MCGIAGLIDFADRPIEPEKVLRMAAAQSHRGPDGAGVIFFFSDGQWKQFASLDSSHVSQQVQGSVGALAHRRLAIIDLSERAVAQN